MELFVRRATVEERFFDSDSYGRSDAGVRVNQDSALTDDGILAAVTLLTGDIANLPMRAFSTNGELTQPLRNQPSWIEAPDPLDLAITDVAHRSQLAISILLNSNAYTLCEPSVFDPVRLTVLDPWRVRVVKPGNERLFEIMGRSSLDGPFTTYDDVVDTLSSAQVIHTPYMLRPGRLEGMSLIAAQSGNVGISLAMRRWVETFFGKGGQVSGFVSLPLGAQVTDVDEVQKQIQSRWSGWRKAGVLGVLSGGSTFIKTGLSPQDADLGALWRRQLEMAARIFGIPPFMIGSQEPAGVAYASSVERAQHYIDHCIARYTRPIEKAYSRLVPGDGRLSVPGSNTEVRFVFDAMLRGDPAARWATHLTALQAKARTIGEVRALENLPPMSSYTPEYLSGPDGLYETPQNSSPSDQTATLIEQVKAGLRTENEAREVLNLPPMKWSDELSPEEVASIIEQVKAGLRTENEARALMKLPPIEWGDDLTPEEIGSLIEQVKSGLLTEDEARKLLKRPPMQWPSGPSPDEIASLVAQVKEGLLTIDEARAGLGRAPVEWPEDLSEKVRQAAELIKAGFDPRDVLAKLGLPPINHLGLPPTTIQTLADAAGVQPVPTGDAAGASPVDNLRAILERSWGDGGREQAAYIEVAIAEGNQRLAGRIDELEEQQRAAEEARQAAMRSIPTLVREVIAKDDLGRPLAIAERRGDVTIHKLIERDKDGRIVRVTEAAA